MGSAFLIVLSSFEKSADVRYYVMLERQLNCGRLCQCQQMAKFGAKIRKGKDPSKSEVVLSGVTCDQLLVGCQLISHDYRYLWVNDAVARHGRRTKEELLRHTMMELYPGIENTEMFSRLKDCLEKRVPHRMENEFVYPDGTKAWFLLNMMPVPDGCLILSEDISDYKLAIEKVTYLYSLQTAIRNINQLVLLADDENRLYQLVCQELGKLEWIRLVWIGFVERGNYNVRPVAHAGFEDGFLSSVRITWDNSEYGMGPTGMAIKTGKPCIVQDTAADLTCRPWREERLKRGYVAWAAFPIVYRGNIIGTLNVDSAKANAFGNEEMAFLEEVSRDIALGVKTLRTLAELEQSNRMLREALRSTELTICAMLERRDPYTAVHEQRVSLLAVAIGKEMGLPEDKIEGIRIAGVVHDVGKIAVPAEILSKPGKLTDNEFNIVKAHVQVGYDMMKTTQFAESILQAVLQHHERLDGSGYPRGLRGDEITLEARIMAVADVVEAMSSHRPYRPALGIDKALEEVSRNKGILYDSEVVDACTRLFAEGKFKFE